MSTDSAHTREDSLLRDGTISRAGGAAEMEAKAESPMSFD